MRRANGNIVPSTRDLIRHVGWAATALIAHQTGRYVARKRDCHRFYSELIGDEWSDLIAEIFECCRGDWGYLLPTAPDDRARLRAICVRTLAFERYFLGVYKAYALRELRGDDRAARAMVVDVLRRVPFPDAEVASALADVLGEEVP